MTREEVTQVVTGAISRVQELCGDHTPVNEETCPAEDLAYDSIRTVETTMDIAEELGSSFDATLNLFAPEPDVPRVQVRHIVERACLLVGVTDDGVESGTMAAEPS